MLHKILYLVAVSPVHNGTGQGIGMIDNPILRQRDTHLPIIQGSSIKGVLRDEWKDKDRDVIRTLFGPDPKSTSAHAGAISLGDAQLLLFPIRSLKGAFVWATSPLALALFQKHLDFAGISIASLEKLMDKLKSEDISPTQVWVSKDSLNELNAGDQVVLEEYAFQGTEHQVITDLADKLSQLIFTETSPDFLKEHFKKRLVLLPEDDFRYFITFATEVTPNIRIGDSGATETGSLRYTEYLPAQSILFSLWSIDKGRSDKASQLELDTAQKVWEKVNTKINDKFHVQIGGNATVGKGLMEMKFHPN